MDNSLKLRVMFDTVDNMTRPLRNMLTGSKSLAQSLQQTRRELTQMRKQQNDIAEFRELRQGLASTESRLHAAKTRVTELARAMRAAGRPTREMVAQFESARRVTAALASDHEKQSARVHSLRERLSAVGISTRNLAEHQRALTDQARKANRTLREQEEALARVGRQQQRLHAARAQFQSARQVAGGLMSASASTGALGGGMLYGAKRLLSSGYEFDAAMSKVQALARIEKNSGELSALREQARMLGATTSFTAGDAASGQGFLAMAGFSPDQIIKAMPGVLSMAKAGDTDLAQTADISSNILTGFGLKADEMNRVADVLTMTFTTSNTTLEMLGGTMKYVGPIARAAGMSLEQAAATAGLLGNAGIQATQAGTTLRSMLLRLSAPTSGASAALKELGVRALDARGNVRDIPSILRDVAKATEQLGSGTRLNYLKKIFGEEPAAGMSELIAQQGALGIEKYVTILRDASGTAQNVASVMADNLKGDLLTAESAFADLGVSISDAVNPALRAFTRTVTGYLGRASRWVQENPRLARTIGVITLGLGGMLAAVSALALIAATVVGPLALLRLGLATLGIQGVLLTRVLSLASLAWRAFSTGAMLAARALLANPIVLAIAAIMAAALVIYRYWEPIKAFFTELWQAIRAAFADGLSAIAGALGNRSPLATLRQSLVAAVSFLTSLLPAKFVNLGQSLVAGLVQGLTAGLGAVKGAITSLAGSAVAWFKAKLGIHSPSRVFGELGGFITQGAALGMERQQTRVARAALGLATVAASAFALPAIATGAQLTKTVARPLVRPTVPIDTQQPVATSPAATRAAATASNITVNVYPPPGADAVEIARMVRLELERAERAKQSRIGSRLTD